jgi:glycosyltransferase involved in cell wall biosynthesis
MIHIFINGISASAGGGLTYIRNVLPRLTTRNDVRATVLLSSNLRKEFKESASLCILQRGSAPGTARRFWYEQSELPGMIRKSGADVLLSPGNFAIFNSPVPQILLSGNSLYTSRDFVRDLRDRGEYRMWMENALRGALARWSVRKADCTVAPSAAFAAELRQWTGNDVLAIHHGFDREFFFGDKTLLSSDVEALLAATAGTLRLLFVSHYNYYRNFETLIRALAILKNRLHPRKIRLILTCKLNSDNPGNYRAEGAADLARALGLDEEIVQLGAVPYRLLHHVYRGADLYVTPAYAETFSHTLVEAMAGGLPVIASDIAAHREICGGAALYFPRFSPACLARSIIEVSQSTEQVDTMRKAGLSRSQDFSWNRHVEQLLLVARQLVEE